MKSNDNFWYALAIVVVAVMIIGFVILMAKGI
jgi:hypothetical protein